MAPEQLNLLTTFTAQLVAAALSERLEQADNAMEAFSAFCKDMHDGGDFVRSESFEVLEIVGLGTLVNCFAWWMHDSSILLVGLKSENELVIGALAPESEFHIAPSAKGQGVTLH